MEHRKRLHSFCFSDSELDQQLARPMCHYASLDMNALNGNWQLLPLCVFTSNPDILEFAVPCMHLDEDDSAREAVSLRSFLAQPGRILQRSTSVCCLRSYSRLPVENQTDNDDDDNDGDDVASGSCVDSTPTDSWGNGKRSSGVALQFATESSDSDEDIHKDCQYAGEEQEAEGAQVLQSDSVLHHPKLMQQYGYYTNELALAEEETTQIKKRFNAQPMVAFDMFSENVYPACNASQPALQSVDEAETVVDELDPVEWPVIIDEQASQTAVAEWQMLRYELAMNQYHQSLAFNQQLAFPQFAASHLSPLYDEQSTFANTQAFEYRVDSPLLDWSDQFAPYCQMFVSRKRTMGERCQSKFRLTIYVEKACGFRVRSTRSRKCPRFSCLDQRPLAEICAKNNSHSQLNSTPVWLLMDAMQADGKPVGGFKCNLQQSEMVTFRFPLDWQQRSSTNDACLKPDPPIRLLVASCQKPQNADSADRQSAWKRLKAQRRSLREHSQTATSDGTDPARKAQPELGGSNVCTRSTTNNPLLISESVSQSNSSCDDQTRTSANADMQRASSTLQAAHDAKSVTALQSAAKTPAENYSPSSSADELHELNGGQMDKLANPLRHSGVANAVASEFARLTEDELLLDVNEAAVSKKAKTLRAARSPAAKQHVLLPPPPDCLTNGSRKCEAWLDNISPAKVVDSGSADTDSGILSSSSTTLLTCRSLGDLHELNRSGRTKSGDSHLTGDRLVHSRASLTPNPARLRPEKPKRTSSLPRLAMRQRKDVHFSDSSPTSDFAPAWENLAEAELNYLRSQTDQILDTISSVSSSLQHINGDTFQDSATSAADLQLAKETAKALGEADLLEALAAEKARIDAVGKKIKQDTEKSRELLMQAKSNIDALKKELETHANKAGRNLADSARENFLKNLDSEKRNWLLERQSARDSSDPDSAEKRSPSDTSTANYSACATLVNGNVQLPKLVDTCQLNLPEPRKELLMSRYPVRFRDALRKYETAINTELECLRDRMQCLKFQAQM